VLVARDTFVYPYFLLLLYYLLFLQYVNELFAGITPNLPSRDGYPSSSVWYQQRCN
jgi:hypothetical protein